MLNADLKENKKTTTFCRGEMLKLFFSRCAKSINPSIIRAIHRRGKPSMDEQFLGGGAGGGEDAEEVDSLWEGRDVEGVVCVDG